MKQINNNTKKSKWEQIKYKTRLRIEVMQKEGKKAAEISKATGYSKRTIERELKRGQVRTQRTKYDPYAAIIPTKREKREVREYSADAAQKAHNEAASVKGRQLKIGSNHAFAAYIEEKIGKEKLSPYAALERAKQEHRTFAGLICTKTLYNYIDANLFLNISNKDLWVKRSPKKRKYVQIRPAYTNLKGRSIEERPKEMLKRQESGHWEADTVVGKGRVCLLVMTERRTRSQKIIKLKRRSQAEVINALDKLERKLGAAKFRRTFKTITTDNGGEFLNQEGIEKSCINKKTRRTIVYYCHPYSAWERGSNENANRLIRRFIPKSAKICDYTEKEIKRIEHYINNYPRKLFDGRQSISLYLTA